MHSPVYATWPPTIEVATIRQRHKHIAIHMNGSHDLVVRTTNASAAGQCALSRDGVRCDVPAEMNIDKRFHADRQHPYVLVCYVDSYNTLAIIRSKSMISVDTLLGMNEDCLLYKTDTTNNYYSVDRNGKMHTDFMQKPDRRELRIDLVTANFVGYIIRSNAKMFRLAGRFFRLETVFRICWYREHKDSEGNYVLLAMCNGERDCAYDDDDFDVLHCGTGVHVRIHTGFGVIAEDFLRKAVAVDDGLRHRLYYVDNELFACTSVDAWRRQHLTPNEYVESLNVRTSLSVVQNRVREARKRARECALWTCMQSWEQQRNADNLRLTECIRFVMYPEDIQIPLTVVSFYNRLNIG